MGKDNLYQCSNCLTHYCKCKTYYEIDGRLICGHCLPSLSEEEKKRVVKK